MMMMHGTPTEESEGSDTAYHSVDECSTSDDQERYTELLCMNSSNISFCSVSTGISQLPALHLRKKYIVFEECLLSLFQACRRCGAESTKAVTKVVGTFLRISQHCSNCSFVYKWNSQPYLDNTPAGNILLSAAILFTGTTPAKTLRLLKTYGCACINNRTYFIHQKKYLQPSVFSVWNDHQNKELRKEKRPLALGGDGRADSPGHSAKFGSYTVMELEKQLVIDVQLVQV